MKRSPPKPEWASENTSASRRSEKTIYQIEELKPVLHELKGIGRNLNQLTMLAHQGVIRTVNLTATADSIGRCYAAINRLYADTDAVIQGGG